MRAGLFCLILLGCTAKGKVLVSAPKDGGEVYEEYVERMAHPLVDIRLQDSPRARPGGVQVVVLDQSLDACEGCFRLERPKKRVIEVHASDSLGAQYGLTAAFEAMDVRFFHPHATFAQVQLQPPTGDHDFGELQRPEIDRRGLHLHTLHPIEGLFDFWEPSDEGLARAKRVIDWAIRQRANHVQWVGLDDIQDGVDSDWREHTRAINDYAHSRGITTGLGIQLFGSGNLQQAWDLIDQPGDPATEDEAMRSRLEVVGDVGFDVLNLSFGEFLGEDPETFVDTAERAYDAMQEVAGPVDVPAVIHVGNFDDLRVEYQGEELLYYFLAARTDRDIKPWIHTVMYYNLFEDAGGAYLHDEFDEHREFLIDALGREEPVGYFPETAYWVAFDINVPTYLPVYVRSRWTDLDGLRDQGLQLEDHVLFSSGWEWGYWQNDYASLRASYSLPDRYEVLFEDMFAPFGRPGKVLTDAVVDLADLQHRALIEQRLAAYLAGREAVIDLGDNLGLVSQPDRPQFHEVAAYTAAEAVEMESILAGLAELASETRAIGARVDRLELEASFAVEIRDGIAIDAVRAEFAHAVFSAALVHGQGSDPTPYLAQADRALEEAATIVEARHQALWDPDGDRLTTDERPNATIYDFGYLAMADQLCFWERELAQVRVLVLESDEEIPACIG